MGKTAIPFCDAGGVIDADRLTVRFCNLDVRTGGRGLVSLTIKILYFTNVKLKRWKKSIQKKLTILEYEVGWLFAMDIPAFTSCYNYKNYKNKKKIL